MKANWKVALLCLAMVTFVACDPKNPATDPGTDPSTDTIPGGGGGGGEEEYVSPINIKDHSIADWDALDQSKVVESVCPELPYFPGLLKAKVYADEVCINFLLTFDPEAMPSHVDVDGLHIYLNTDNSDETGGFWDLFAPVNGGNVDILLEGALWDGDGNEMSYTPSVERWNGETNGEGWWWDPVPASSSVAGSQFVGNNMVEGRILKELVPAVWSDEAFEIGFDIYQNFESVGLLPQNNRPDGDHIGRAYKMRVPFDKASK